MRIGIIGGGIAGLTAAYELAKKGHNVTVFEKEAELGGQASTFPIEGTRLEKFYHHAPICCDQHASIRETVHLFPPYPRKLMYRVQPIIQ